MSHFHDSYCPTASELRAWAYDPEAQVPHNDWELVLSWHRHEKVIIEAASGDGCPHQTDMLDVLYFIVGHAVHAGLNEATRAGLAGFIDRADEYPHSHVRSWQERSRALLKDPDTFDYTAWCGGGIARDSS